MKLQDIFDSLKYGELSQISLGGQDPGVINEANYAQLLSHINLGLIELYKRFNLKQGQFVLQLQTGRMVYPLTSAYAVTNTRSREEVRYILDTVSDPFKDEINKVIRIHGMGKHEIALNDIDDKYSLYTPTQLLLRVPSILAEREADLPYALQTNLLTVVYQAAHPKITVPIGFFDPTRVTLELPDTHMNALLLFVASRVNNPVGMVNEFNAGNNYAAKFEMECQALENQGMEIDQGAGNTRLRRNGWA